MAFLGGLKIAALHKTEELATSYCQDSYISFRFQKTLNALNPKPFKITA